MNEDFSDVILVTEDKKQMFSFNVQLAIYQSLKLLKNASQDKEEVFEGGWSVPLLLPLPTKTSSLSCEAFSIIKAKSFDRSLVEGKQ